MRDWGWVVGALPPQPRTVDLKVSEMSAFGLPRVAPHDRCGKILVNVGKKRLQKIYVSYKMKVLSRYEKNETRK